MPPDAYRLTPWTDVAQPHKDVLEGSLDMGTYAVNLARVFRQAPGVPDVYRRADRFFETTYLTGGLQRLLTDVLRALGGGGGDRVLQLRTPFGGGKSHGLVALTHLVRDRAAAQAIPEFAELPDPGLVQLAVLSGEELDPVQSRHTNGTETHTLWGELAAQLGRFELVAEHDRLRSAPGGDTLRGVLGDGPVLVLLDEILVYVEKAMVIGAGQSNLGRQAMLFMQALTEVVNNHPCAVMVYSLQASAQEAVGSENLLDQLDHLVSRVDAKREPVSGDEVLRVVQRRLFADPGPAEVRRRVARTYAELIERQLTVHAETDDQRYDASERARRFEERAVASYPFHPALLDLMYQRWGTLPSYQRTRGALQFLACVTHALWRPGGMRSPLIGPGEVDLDDEAVRNAFFTQVGERERFINVIDADIRSPDSGAARVNAQLGEGAPALAQLRVGTRMATAVMLYSFGAPEGEDRGVLENELIAGTLVPGLDRNMILAALHVLRDEEIYLHASRRRYRFEPAPNLSKLVRDEAQRVSNDDVLAEVRRELEEQLAQARNVRIWPDPQGKPIDDIPGFTLVFLRPDWDAEEGTLRRLVEGPPGRGRGYRNAVGLVLPDSAQFDRARLAARTLKAADTLIRRARHQFNQDQVAELREKRDTAASDLSTAVGRSYGEVAVPVKATEGMAAYIFERHDLRSMQTFRRTLESRIHEALAGRVFDRVTFDKLAALVGLGPDRPVVRCGELVNWFFSYLEFTKLWDTKAIREAIAKGVIERRFAYATGLEEADGTVTVRDPRAVRLGAAMSLDDIDLSDVAAILTVELAESLLKPAEPEPGTPEPEPGAETDGRGDGQTSGRPGGVAQPGSDSGGSGPTKLGPTDLVHTVGLRVRANQDVLFPLQKALSWLREQSTSMGIELTVRVTTKPEGIEQGAFNLRVRELLEEAGAELTDVDLR